MKVNNVDSGKCEMHDFLRLPLQLCRRAGMFPIEGLNMRRTCTLRYNIRSAYMIYHLTTLIWQTLLFWCSIHAFFTSDVNLSTATSLLFYSNAFLSMAFLMKLARKWPKLIRRASGIETLVASMRCTNDWDKKSRSITSLIMVLASVEHVLSVLFKMKLVMNCSQHYFIDSYFCEIYFVTTIPYLFDYTPYSMWKALVYEIAQIQATFLWSIIDVITICISMYLVSYFRDLNKMVRDRKDTEQIPWEQIRVYYSHLIELVRETDNELCLLILLSVFTNLCFICLQIFYLVNRIYPNMDDCQYEQVVLTYKSSEHFLYYSFSTVFLFIKASAMFLLASNVNNEASKPILTLMYVPASEYTIEVQRFSRQVRYTTNALSGYLFYITRPMILQAASTILKYELVLLQTNYND